MRDKRLFSYLEVGLNPILKLLIVFLQKLRDLFIFISLTNVFHLLWALVRKQLFVLIKQTLDIAGGSFHLVLDLCLGVVVVDGGSCLFIFAHDDS